MSRLIRRLVPLLVAASHRPTAHTPRWRLGEWCRQLRPTDAAAWRHDSRLPIHARAQQNAASNSPPAPPPLILPSAKQNLCLVYHQNPDQWRAGASSRAAAALAAGTSDHRAATPHPSFSPFPISRGFVRPLLLPSGPPPPCPHPRRRNQLLLAGLGRLSTHPGGALPSLTLSRNTPDPSPLPPPSRLQITAVVVAAASTITGARATGTAPPAGPWSSPRRTRASGATPRGTAATEATSSRAAAATAAAAGVRSAPSP